MPANPGSTQVTRGKVTASKVGARTFLQITGLDGVVQNLIELQLPPGFSARPLPGADVLLLEIGGASDHLVALGGDTVRKAIASLEPGEFGLSDGTNMIIVRTDHIQLISPTKIRCETPRLECTGEIVAQCDGGFVTLSQHHHPSNGAPPTSHT